MIPSHNASRTARSGIASATPAPAPVDTSAVRSDRSVEQVLCGACGEQCCGYLTECRRVAWFACEYQQEVGRGAQPVLLSTGGLPEQSQRAVAIMAFQPAARAARGHRDAQPSGCRRQTPHRERSVSRDGASTEHLADIRGCGQPRFVHAGGQGASRNNQLVSPLASAALQDQPPAARAHAGQKSVSAPALQIGDGPEVFFHRKVRMHYRRLASVRQGRDKKSLLARAIACYNHSPIRCV